MFRLNIGKIAMLFLKENGIGVANLVLLGYVSFKLFTNHFAHLQEAVEKNGEELVCIREKTQELSERISTVEGKLS